MANDSGIPKELDEHVFPVGVRKAINKLIELAKRPWEIAFNTSGKNEVHFSHGKVIIDLTTIKVTVCMNGKPRVVRLVGQIDRTQDT